jgi:predicted ATPase
MADSLDKFSNPWDKEIASELRRLHQFERGYNEWTEKTQWVQDTKQTHELGMHRADVLKQRIERLETVNQELLAALKEKNT